MLSCFVVVLTWGSSARTLVVSAFVSSYSILSFEFWTLLISRIACRRSTGSRHGSVGLRRFLVGVRMRILIADWPL